MNEDAWNLGIKNVAAVKAVADAINRLAAAQERLATVAETRHLQDERLRAPDHGSEATPTP